MTQFKAFAEGVEVNGATVFSVIDGMGTFRNSAISILSENGIVDLKPDGWYSQQAWLNAFKVISDKIGSSTLLAIGRKIPENAQFPPEIDSIEKAMAAIDVAYHMNHRGGEIGHYHYKENGENSVRLVCENPYPCEFDRGIIDAMARRFKPDSSVYVKVKHDDSAPCRKKGENSCTYIIEW